MTETRAEKAQRLVDEGRVGLFYTEGLFSQAEIRLNLETYLTTIYANGTFWCNCEWGQYHSYTDDLCAHALAVKLAVKANDDAERANTDTLLNALDETWGI